MSKQNAGIWASVLLIIFAVTILIQSFSYNYHSTLGPGPGLFPRWLSILLILLTVLYLVESIRKDIVTFAEILPKGKELRKLLIILLSLIVFIFVVPYLGFVVSAMIFLFILLAKEYKWYVGLGISVAVSFGLFWIFDTLLSVPLPVNALGW